MKGQGDSSPTSLQKIVHSPEQTAKLGNVCGIDLNKYNFAQSVMFDPTSSSREGVYLAGAAPLSPVFSTQPLLDSWLSK